MTDNGSHPVSATLNTPTEKLLIKIEDLCGETRLARQEQVCAYNTKKAAERIQAIENGFLDSFVHFACRWFGISPQQLATLNESELKRLAEMITPKARRRSCLFGVCVAGLSLSFGYIIGITTGAPPFLFFFSLFSLMSIVSWCNSYSTQFVSFRRKFKRIFGDDYFPAGLLQKRLRERGSTDG